MKIALAYLLLLTLVMGIVSLFDVYVGFFFFIGWIWYRECCLGAKFFWALVILLGGNLVAGIYAIFVLLKSKGDVKVFFLGETRILKENESLAE